MYGWIVCNEFLNSKEKFKILNARLLNAAKKFNITMDVVTNADLLVKYSKNGKTIIGDRRFPDFVLFMDKDVQLCKALEEQGVRCFNNSQAIEWSDNKRLTADALGTLMPKTVVLPIIYEGVHNDDVRIWDGVGKELGYPMIIKEECGSFGMQVYLVKNAQELNELYNKRGYKGLIAQKFIESSCGRDIRINVVGGQVVAAMERYNDNDFRANITNGGNMRSYLPTREEEALAIQACNKLKLDFAGVDLLFGEKNEKIVCEINSNAHIENIYHATGVDISIKIIEHVLEMI